MYDNQGNAQHYNTERIPGMYALEQMFGSEAMMHFCEINAMKYRMRLGKKEGAPIEQDLTKAKWYEDAAKYYAGLDEFKAGFHIGSNYFKKENVLTKDEMHDFIKANPKLLKNDK